MITDYYLPTIVYAYFVPVIGLSFLLYLIRYNSLFTPKQQKLFIMTAVVNLALIVSTSLDLTFMTGTYPIFGILRRITSFLNFAIGPIIPLLLYKILRQEKSSFFLYLPCIINIVVCFMSMFVNIVFFIELNNAYSRGILFYLPTAVSIYHVLLMFFVPQKNLHKQGRVVEFAIVAVIVFLMIVAVLLETFFYFFCINYGVSAICTIAYYVLKNIHFFKSDPLTGAYNRQMYSKDISRLNKSHNSVIALLDINNFKNVNDTYGHERGDEVLKLFVSVVQQHTQKIAMLYRIGGDEFVIISKKADFQALQRAVDGAAAQLSQHEVSFACGMKSYDSNMDINAFIDEVDKEMYAQKRSMKAVPQLEQIDFA